ncbi:MAG: hypothetical protein ACJA0X_001260, partial [Cyclobacteriaceae bacterium]
YNRMRGNRFAREGKGYKLLRYGRNGRLLN